MAPGISLYSVHAIIILSTDDGSRILAKYYTPPHHAPTPAGAPASTPDVLYTDVKVQKTFEEGLLKKTAKQTGDVIVYADKTVLYKMESDVMMYVVGDKDENSLMLYHVIVALRDTLYILFNKQSVDKRTIIENYDSVSLAIDEIVDDGIILETDGNIIRQRVSKAPTQDVNTSAFDLTTEQGVSNFVQLGKSKLSDWLR